MKENKVTQLEKFHIPGKPIKASRRMVENNKNTGDSFLNIQNGSVNIIRPSA